MAQRVLDHLDRNEVRTRNRCTEPPTEPREEARMPELTDRHVDRDAFRRALAETESPRDRLSAGRVEQARADGDDETGLLGDREELLRSDELTSRPLETQT